MEEKPSIILLFRGDRRVLLDSLSDGAKMRKKEINIRLQNRLVA